MKRKFWIWHKNYFDSMWFSRINNASANYKIQLYSAVVLFKFFILKSCAEIPFVQILSYIKFFMGDYSFVYLQAKSLALNRKYIYSKFHTITINTTPNIILPVLEAVLLTYLYEHDLQSV